MFVPSAQPSPALLLLLWIQRGSSDSGLCPGAWGPSLGLGDHPWDLGTIHGTWGPFLELGDSPWGLGMIPEGWEQSLSLGTVPGAWRQSLDLGTVPGPWGQSLELGDSGTFSWPSQVRSGLLGQGR